MKGIFDHLFEPEWNDAFVADWNVAEKCHPFLVNRGAVHFKVEDIRSCCLFWNEAGIVQIVNAKDFPDAPCFSASLLTWELLINGIHSTVYAVMQKKLHYEGPPKFGIQFSKDFLHIAKIARQVQEKFIARIS